jgi:thiamine biosynthesis protein ThiC
MTQRTKARKGIATKEMEIIAREEGVSPRVVEGQSGLWAANHSGQSEA